MYNVYMINPKILKNKLPMSKNIMTFILTVVTQSES